MRATRVGWIVTGVCLTFVPAFPIVHAVISGEFAESAFSIDDSALVSAAERNPDNHSAQFAKAVLFLPEGDSFSWRNFRIKQLDRLAERDPEDVATRVTMGVIALLGQGSAGAGRRSEVDPSGGYPPEPPVQECERALLDFVQRRLDEARGLDPANAAIDYLLAIRLLRLHEDDAALRTLERMLTKRGWNDYRLTTLRRLGEAYQLTGANVVSIGSELLSEMSIGPLTGDTLGTYHVVRLLSYLGKRARGEGRGVEAAEWFQVGLRLARHAKRPFITVLDAIEARSALGQALGWLSDRERNSVTAVAGRRPPDQTYDRFREFCSNIKQPEVWKEFELARADLERVASFVSEYDSRILSKRALPGPFIELFSAAGALGTVCIAFVVIFWWIVVLEVVRWRKRWRKRMSLPQASALRTIGITVGTLAPLAVVAAIDARRYGVALPMGTASPSPQDVLWPVAEALLAIGFVILLPISHRKELRLAKAVVGGSFLARLNTLLGTALPVSLAVVSVMMLAGLFALQRTYDQLESFYREEMEIGEVASALLHDPGLPSPYGEERQPPALGKQ